MMRLATALGLILMCSCGGDDPPPEESPLRDRLAAGVAVTLEPASEAASVHSTVDFGMTMDEFDLRFGLDAGTVAFRADGPEAIVIESLELELGDLEISPAAFPPDGLTFTDVRATLTEPVSGAATWSPADVDVLATVVGVLRVEWSVAQEGAAPLPLSPVDVDAVELRLDAVPEGDRVRVMLIGDRRGDILSWADSVTLSDLVLSVGGTD
jgi:hypothetical protein